MRNLAFAAALLAASCVSAGEPVALEAGSWGGPMVMLEVGGGGTATIQESCGEIALEAIRPDVEGRFATRGRMTSYTPGLQAADETPETAPVSVAGRVAGEVMVLTIAAPGAPAREATLHKGRRAKIVRCY